VKQVHLLQVEEARNYRKLVGSSYYEYGHPAQVVDATGRAVCRQCGHKIEKGTKAVKFVHDFGGCGSFTATEAYIHAFESSCTSPTVAAQGSLIK
jgi:hypothetical protein